MWRRLWLLLLVLVVRLLLVVALLLLLRVRGLVLLRLQVLLLLLPALLQRGPQLAVAHEQQEPLVLAEAAQGGGRGEHVCRPRLLLLHPHLNRDCALLGVKRGALLQGLRRCAAQRRRRAAGSGGLAGGGAEAGAARAQLHRGRGAGVALPPARL